MKAYKGILAEEGIFPDLEDKERESRLIVQLLRLEKGLSAKVPVKKSHRKVKPKPTNNGRGSAGKANASSWNRSDDPSGAKDTGSNSSGPGNTRSQNTGSKNSSSGNNRGPARSRMAKGRRTARSS